jgi:hypothetical protein
MIKGSTTIVKENKIQSVFAYRNRAIVLDVLNGDLIIDIVKKYNLTHQRVSAILYRQLKVALEDNVEFKNIKGAMAIYKNRVAIKKAVLKYWKKEDIFH